MRKFLTTLLVSLLAWSGAGLSAPAQEFTLDNGMKVIVKEDHRSPTVVSQVWYRVGALDEMSGTSGIAHMLEHMMFKGTPSVAPGDFSKIIAANGGRDNAFTGHDYTAYFQQLHKAKLELALKMEADRMVNLLFDEQEFQRERKVVTEERRLRTEDQAHSRVYEQLMAAMFSAHPYRRPIIGFMNDIENYTLADAKAWYERWYTPNNAALVVAGDVDPQEVRDLAQKYFAAIPARALPPRKPQQEPPQLGIKRINVKAPSALPYIAMAYHAPALRDPADEWEPYALQVLMGVLDGTDSARLVKTLVREQGIAQEVGAGYDALQRGPGTIVIDGTPREGKTVAELEAALRAEIERVKTDGVTEAELKRVIANVVAAQVFQRDSVFYQAMQIGTLETSGLSHKDMDLMVDKLRAVTAQQVQQVAQKYLQDDNLTVAVLDPQPLQPKQAPAVEGVRHTQ
jgi:zinc protease